MEGLMLRRYLPVIAISAFSLLTAGCYGPPPPPERVVVAPSSGPIEIVPPEAPDEHAIAIAPGPPPPARVEAIPAPPSEAVYWVPGHWRWYGTADGHSGWAWTAGYYAERPSHTAIWIDGHWQQSSAGYVWVEGYWR